MHEATITTQRKVGFRVRSAERIDVEGLIELYENLNPGDAKPSVAEAMAIFDRFHRYAGSVILVGEVDGKLVATCTLVVVPNLTRGGRPYGLVENVVTDRAYRRHGYASELLRAAQDAAWQADCYKVMLLTGSTNLATHRFYRSVGFKQSKTGFQMRRVPSRPN